MCFVMCFMVIYWPNNIGIVTAMFLSVLLDLFSSSTDVCCEISRFFFKVSFLKISRVNLVVLFGEVFKHTYIIIVYDALFHNDEIP